MAGGAGLGDLRARLCDLDDVVSAVAVSADGSVLFALCHCIEVHAVQGACVVVEVAAFAGLVFDERQLSPALDLRGLVWDRQVALMTVCAGQPGPVDRMAKAFAVEIERQGFSVGEGHGKLGIAVTGQAVVLGCGGSRMSWRRLLGRGRRGFLAKEAAGGGQGQDSDGEEAANGKPNQHSADPEQRHGEGCHVASYPSFSTPAGG
jgi:hypothetical protein